MCSGSRFEQLRKNLEHGANGRSPGTNNPPGSNDDPPISHAQLDLLDKPVRFRVTPATGCPGCDR